MNEEVSMQASSRVYKECQHDDIDLKALFLVLWQGKFIILMTTILFALFAVGYAWKQPNIYQATSMLSLNPDPYGLVKDIDYQGKSSSSVF